MVDVDEGEEGGKNQPATPKEPAWKEEDEFATREPLNRIK